jgi:hypothetical protein
MSPRQMESETGGSVITLAARLHLEALALH